MANESRTYGRDRLSFSQDPPLNLNVGPASPPGPGSRNPGESGSNPRLSGLLHRPVSKSNYPRLSGLLHRPVSKLRSSHVRTSHGRSEQQQKKRNTLIKEKNPPLVLHNNTTIGEGNGGKRQGWRVSSTRSTADRNFRLSWAQWHVARQLWTITRHLGFWVPFGVAAEAVIARATRIPSGESGLPPEQRAIVRRVH
jgi:hypothetical protein